MIDHTLQELGFKKVINAAGHYTVFGGSCPSPKVVRAMKEAAREWIDVRALQASAGMLLSETVGCDNGIVTSGAYAANSMAAQTALTMAREKNSGLASPNIVIQSSHITKYAESFTSGGIRLKEVTRSSKSDSLADLIDDSTIAVAYVINESEFEFSLRETVDVCKVAGVPVIVDAAVVDPPIRGIREVLAYDPDFITVSGGKGFNGPNDSGLLLGKSDLISRARELSFPNYGPGRGMKVSKEQIAGLLIAVKLASKIDDDKLIEGWKKEIKEIEDSVTVIAGVRTQIFFPWRLNFPQAIPRLGIFIETPGGEEKAERVRQGLANGVPPILTRPLGDVSKDKNVIMLDVRTLRSGEARIVAESLRLLLRRIVP